MTVLCQIQKASSTSDWIWQMFSENCAACPTCQPCWQGMFSLWDRFCSPCRALCQGSQPAALRLQHRYTSGELQVGCFPHQSYPLFYQTNGLTNSEILKVSLGSTLPLTSLGSMRIDIAQYLAGFAQHLAVLCSKDSSWAWTECKQSKICDIMKFIL